MKGSAKFVFFSFIVGSAIGAMAGLLFAPDKGSATREKLRGKAKDLSDNLSDKYDSLKDELKHLKEKMKTDKGEKVEVNPE